MEIGSCIIVDVCKYINEDHEFEPSDSGMHIAAVEKYIETLVSPNRYIVYMHLAALKLLLWKFVVLGIEI